MDETEIDMELVQRVAAAVMTQAGIPSLSCRMRMCRRAGSCQRRDLTKDPTGLAACWASRSPFDEQAPQVDQAGLVLALHDAFLARMAAMPSQPGLTPERLADAIATLRRSLPKRQWRPLKRWLAAVSAPPLKPQPASLALALAAGKGEASPSASFWFPSGSLPWPLP